MNTITFNKKYTKLPAGIKTAVLIACEPVKGENQTLAFLRYDTLDKDCWIANHRGDYLCLVLKSDSGAIFTTLRNDNGENRDKYMRYTGDNRAFYIPLYGKEFQIIIKEG